MKVSGEFLRWEGPLQLRIRSSLGSDPEIWRHMNFGDILVYGDGKVYVSLSTTVPNITKQSFLYDSGLIQMFWFDVFIAQVFNSHISAIDNSGKQHHLYRPDADKIFLTASSGNAWMAALTATNEVYILDQELTLRYVVEKPGERIMQRRTLCGYRQAFIIDDNTAYRYVAAPHSKYYDWANEITVQLKNRMLITNITPPVTISILIL